MVNRRASLAPQGLITTLHSHVLAPLVYCVALGLILGSVGYFCACTFQQRAQFLRRALPDLAKLKFIVVNPLILRVVDTCYFLMIWAACSQGTLPDARPWLANKPTGSAQCLSEIIAMKKSKNSDYGSGGKISTGQKPGSDLGKSDIINAIAKGAESAPSATGNRPAKVVSRSTLSTQEKHCRHLLRQLIDCLNTPSGPKAGETGGGGQATLVKPKCNVQKRIRATRYAEKTDHLRATNNDDDFEIADITLNDVSQADSRGGRVVGDSHD